VRKILAYLGEPISPPRLAPARGPPAPLVATLATPPRPYPCSTTIRVLTGLFREPRR
jgi:hypothetical protein